MNSKRIVLTVVSTTIKLVVTIVVVIFLYRGAMLAYDYGYRIFAEGSVSPGVGRTITVYIPEGSGPSEIGEILQNNGLIRDSKLFILQNMVSAHRNDLKAGVYELNTSQTAFEMMDIIAGQVEEEEE